MKPRFVRRSVVLWLVVILATLGVFWSGPAAETGRVVWVYDGDTIKVRFDQGTVRVRVFGIDCPEKGQPYADEARKQMIAWARDRQVSIEVKDRDQYGRIVGRVFLEDGTDLGARLVAQGLAWHYRRYSDDPDLERLQNEARRAGRGLWASAHPMPPWEFKHRR